MQVLTPLLGQILGALFVIGFFGIYMEKRYVSWWSVGGNALGLIFTYAALDLEIPIIVVLSFYAIIGVICAIKRVKWVYALFGSKTYGSALLVLGIFSIEGAHSLLNGFFMAFGAPSLPNIALFLISWGVVALITNIIGYIVRKRKDDDND